MRISELSRRSGVPVPTIKYYLRERLLPAGTVTAPNQAVYDERHLGRLRLVRAVLEVGGLSVTTVRAVLHVVDEAHGTRGEVLGAAHAALGPGRRAAVDRDLRAAAAREVDGLISRRGWQLYPGTRSYELLCDVLATLRGLQLHGICENLDRYAEAADQLAQRDVAGLTDLPDPADPESNCRTEAVEAVVAGTVLGEALLGAVYTLARESAVTHAYH